MTRTAVGFDVRNIGKHMSRQRYQRGTLRSFIPGKGRRKDRRLPRGTYWARWYRYVKQPDGSERRCDREKIISKELATKHRIGTEYVGPLTKADAQRVLDLLIGQDAGTYVPPDGDVTFGSIAREFVAINEPNWGHHVVRTTKNVIEVHLIGKLGCTKIVDLDDPMALQIFLNGYVSGGASQSLLDKIKLYLRSILDLAVIKGVIKANPARNPAHKLRAKSRKRKSDRALSLEECRRLLAAVIGRDQLILRIFIQLGLRPEELFGLRHNDVLGDALRIDEVVVGGIAAQTKTEASNDIVHVPPDLAADLRSWIARSSRDGNAWLFPNTRGGSWEHHNYLNRILKPAGVRAKIGLREIRRKAGGEPVYTSDLNFQILRRTSATLYGDRAKDPRLTQAHLRHADPQITLRHYQQVVPESAKAAAARLESDLFEGVLRGQEKNRIQ